MTRASAAPVRARSLAWLGVPTDDVDAAGVHFIGPVHHGDAGAAWSHFTGPDGQVYELTQLARSR